MNICPIYRINNLIKIKIFIHMN